MSRRSALAPLLAAVLIGALSPVSGDELDGSFLPTPDVSDRQDVADIPAGDHDVRQLTAERRERRIDLVHGEIVLRRLFAEATVYRACADDIASRCRVEERAPLACLTRHVGQLDRCCAASLRARSADPRLREPLPHHGMILPVGSTLSYDDDCGRSRATLPESVRHGTLWLGPGEVELDADGRLLTARLTPLQRVGGYWLAGGDERIRFHESGHPVEARLARKSMVEGLTLGPGDRPTGWHANGRLARGTVAAVSVRDGLTVGPGPIELDPAGTVRVAVLGADLVLPRMRVPAGTTVWFDESGQPVQIYPAGPLTAAGLPVLVGNRTFELLPSGLPRHFQTERFAVVGQRLFPAQTSVELNDDGEVVEDSFRSQMENRRRWAEADGAPHPVELAEARSFGSLTLPAGSWLTHRPEGRRHEAVVGRTYAVSGLSLGPGRIEFTAEGAITKGHLAHAQAYRGLVLGPGEVRLHAGGGVERATAGSRQRVGTIILADGSAVEFHENGALASAVLAPGSRLAGNALDERADVTWFDSGELKSLDVEQAIVVRGVEYDGATMHFDSSGHLLDAVLNRNATVDGLTYAAGTQLRLDERQRVVHSLFAGRRWPDGAPPTRPAPDDGFVVAHVGTERAPRWPLPVPMSAEECASTDFDGVGYGFATGVTLKAYRGCDPEADRGIVPSGGTR